jgi:hypothetical protein
VFINHVESTTNNFPAPSLLRPHLSMANATKREPQVDVAAAVIAAGRRSPP